MAVELSISRKAKLYNVLRLSASFVRNLAYYRVGWSEEHKHLLDKGNDDFWRVVNANFLDMSVLDWCKLFGEEGGKHHWRKIVTDPVTFEAGLLAHLALDEEAFNKHVRMIRKYRDKWVAHLDLDSKGCYPALEVAKQAVWFLWAHIMKHEVEPTEFMQFTRDIESGYEHCEREADAVYKTAASMRSVLL
jgi:hypothetical protein